MSIRVLPADVATRIAAGEVVERPASVVKELIENAIDAGASQVRLEMQGGGRRQMRVLDDGCGIPAAEVELAFARHSTSKLTSADDLTHIRTLGFRGEALASIASVSRVTLVTRVQEEPIGMLLRLEGGRVVAREPSGRPPGTAITVDDLFFNVPARRKFLRTERTERRHIDALVTRYAMAYPNLRLTLAHAGRATFQSTGSGDLRDVLISVYGASNATQMIAVGPLEMPHAQTEAPHPDVRVSGYVSAPALHRSNRNEITIFVNGRWVHDQRLAFAVVQAFHTLLMTGRYPLAVIKVELLPEDVDVNVHPAKTQVRFRDGDAVFRAVQRAVRRALMDQVAVPQVRVASEPLDRLAGISPLDTGPLSETRGAGRRESAGWPGAWPTPEQVVRRARLRAIGTRTPEHLDPPRDLEAVQSALDLTHPPVVRSAATDSADDGPESTIPVAPAVTGAHGMTSPSAQGMVQPAEQLPVLRVVGQLGLTYIVAEGPEGMFLVDQHAAHERVLYEKFISEVAKTQVAAQALLEPMMVESTAEGASLVEEHLETILALGFDLEPFGGNALLVRAVPATLVDTDIKTMFNEIVADLQVGDEPLANEVEARIVRRVCKQAAIKAGQALSRQEMEELIRQLEACAAPRTCPHGRPTMIHLGAEQLAREFGRLG